MRILIALAVFILAATSSALAQAPKGAPPIFKVVASTDPDKGHIVFRETIYKTETRVERRKEVKNGKEIEVERTVNVTVPFESNAIIVASTSRVITPDGKQLPIDEVWKRVKTNTVVVLSGDGNMPDPAYLRALSAETIVIVPIPPKGRPK